MSSMVGSCTDKILFCCCLVRSEPKHVLYFEEEKRDDRNNFVKKTRARLACIILFDETFRLIFKSLSIC